MILERRGTMYDPEMVTAFLRIAPQVSAADAWPNARAV
jgi:hypothetical protein